MALAKAATRGRSQTKTAAARFSATIFSWKMRGWMFAQARIPLHWEQLMKTFSWKKRFAIGPCSVPGGPACPAMLSLLCTWQGTPCVSTGMEIQEGWCVQEGPRGPRRSGSAQPCVDDSPQSIPSCTSCSLFAQKGQSLLPAKAFPAWQGFHEADRGGETQEPEVSPHAKCSSTSSLLLKEGHAPLLPLPAALSLNSFSSLFFS